MEVNLDGVFHTFRCAAAHMKQRSKEGDAFGRLVSTASLAAVSGQANGEHYAATKGGLISMNKALAVEYASRGIRINALSPGLIDTQIWTDIMDAAPDKDECLNFWKSNIPMGRVGTTEEVANVAVFLVSDKASYITGTNIVSDGGMTSQLISQAQYESKPIE